MNHWRIRNTLPDHIPAGVGYSDAYARFVQEYYGFDRTWATADEKNFALPVFFGRGQAHTLVHNHVVSSADIDFSGLGPEIRQALMTDIYIADLALPQGVAGSGLSPLPLAVFVVSLDGRDEEQLFVLLSKTARNLVRRAQERFTIRTMQGYWNDDLMTVYRTAMNTHGTPPKSRSFFDALAHTFGEDFSVITASDEQGIQALNVVLYGNHAAWLVINASTDAGKRGDANYILYWELLRQALNRQMAFVDFGGSSADGHSRFKLAFGAVQMPLYRLRSGTLMGLFGDWLGRKRRAVRIHWNKLWNHS